MLIIKGATCCNLRSRGIPIQVVMILQMRQSGGTTVVTTHANKKNRNAGTKMRNLRGAAAMYGKLSKLLRNNMTARMAGVWCCLMSNNSCVKSV